MSLLKGSGQTGNRPVAPAGNSPISSTSISGYVRARKPIDFGSGASNCFDMESHVDGLAFPVIQDQIGRQNLVGQPVFLVDPCQGGASPLKTATVSQNPGDGLNPSNFSYLFVAAQTYAFDGSNLQRITTSNQRDNINSLNVASLRSSNQPGTTVGAQTLGFVTDLNLMGIHQVSGTNSPQTVIVDMRNLSSTLSINMVTSAGTATVTTSASVDNTNFLTVDSIAAAAATAKIYGPTTAGGTTAIAPLSYRYFKVVVGTAGVGNTTTLDMGAH